MSGQQFTDGMKQEFDRVSEGLKDGGPSSDHQRQGENTQGLLDRYGPGGSAFSTTDNAKAEASSIGDQLKSATGIGQSKTDEFKQGATDELKAAASGPNSDSDRLV